MSGAFPILSVEDLEAVVAFYERLGFSRTYGFPEEGVPAFVTLERGPDTIGVAARNAGDDTTFSYWVYVDDIDATFEELTVAGATTVARPHAEPWGERVATVRDPAGNPVHIGTPTADP
jgi:lactoylglutathione lyase